MHEIVLNAKSCCKKNLIYCDFLNVHNILIDLPWLLVHGSQNDMNFVLINLSKYAGLSLLWYKSSR